MGIFIICFYWILSCLLGRVEGSFYFHHFISGMARWLFKDLDQLTDWGRETFSRNLLFINYTRRCLVYSGLGRLSKELFLKKNFREPFLQMVDMVNFIYTTVILGIGPELKKTDVCVDVFMDLIVSY